MKKFVNLEKSEDFQLLESVSINGIYQDIKNNSDIIKPIATTTIGAGCQNPYFIVNNLFSELQTYEQKKKALENLQVPDIVKDFIQDIREPILNWSESFDLNDIIDSGVYTITGIRESNERDHLPINNFGNNTSISAKLFVTVSPEGNTTYRSIIGQTLFLSNAEGHETKIYTRSANKTSYNGSISYEVTWGDWQVCQGMKEVGVVDSYDSFIDNGMYSGVYNNNGITETFVIITLNDYVVKQPKSVSQLKYALNAITNKSELSIRVGGGQTFTWSEWKPVFDEENIIKLINSKQDKLCYYTENTSTDTAVIKVSHDTDEATFHEDKVEVGVDNCVLLKSEDLLLGEDSYIKVSPEKVSMSSPQGKIEDAVGALVSNANAIATLNGTGEGSVSKAVTDKIAEVVAGAPADLDTLKEIADYIASDKTNAADINNTLTALKTRVYELGDFATAKNAEDKAREPLYSGNEGISIIHYTVNGSTEGLILQHQDIDGDYHRSVQTLFYHARQYVRFVWFTDSTRTVLLESANFNGDWWETSISHLEYDKTTHTIKCRRIGQDVNSTKWITLPSASTSTDGLMTMAQVKSLEGKQDQLVNYVEEPGGKTTIKYPNGTARVEVSNVRAALWVNDDKVAIAADANGTRMLYQKTAEDGSIEHRDEISIGKHSENSATHITLTSKSTTEEAGEKITNTSTIQVNPYGISMSSPNGEIGDIVKEISEKASSESVSELRQEVEDKAPKVGYAPDLKVNFAKELVGRGEATPEVIGNIRPTGEISIGDGNATIAKIKGSSVVWNQLIVSMSRKDDYDGITTYYDADTNEFVLKNLSRTSNYNSGSTRGALNLVQKILPNHRYCLYGNNNYKGIGICTSNVSPFSTYTLNVIFQNSEQYLWSVRITKDFDFATYCPVGSEFRFRMYLYDLTLMFGAGNEPTTIEEFEARKPLNVTNEYNEGTLVSYQGGEIKSVGFNAYDGTYAKVIGGETYHATGTTSISFAKELDGDKTPITLDSDNKFIPEEDGYVYAEGKDIVIHLTHSYTPEHVDEYEEDVHLLPDITSILDAEGDQLFPYGLLSAGSVYDEITATKAIKRVGVVDIGALPWARLQYENTYYYFRKENKSVARGKNGSYSNVLCKPYTSVEVGTQNLVDKSVTTFFTNNLLLIRDDSYTDVASFKAANQGVLLYYELAEPIEVDLPEPLNMTYEAWDFGTEELVAEGATTPLNADIVYQFNAVDRIRENSSSIDDLEEHVEEHKDDGIELLTNGNLKLTLKGETREFMPATPSGDPMHYAYVSTGAEYNATDDFILKNAPWKDMVDTIEDKAKWSLDVVDASNVQQMTIKGVEYNYATENRTSPEGGTYLRYFIVGKGSNGVWVEDETKVLHLPGCWYLNGLGDITDKEMFAIYRDKNTLGGLVGGVFIATRNRTLIDKVKFQGGTVNLGDRYCHTMFLTSLISPRINISSIGYCFNRASALKYITTEYVATYLSNANNAFQLANLLKVIYLSGLKMSLSFKDSKYISKLSVKYMIENAAPTSAITITLHADAYARLAEDADIVAALEAKPLVTLVSA